jgi:hypothetical protein
MAKLLPQGKQAYTDSAGDPLSGGLLYTYAAGTSTPLATYSDQAGTTPNANPVVLDARGEATVFWSESSYKVVLHDEADAPIWTQDNIGPEAITATGADTARTQADWQGAVKGWRSPAEWGNHAALTGAHLASAAAQAATDGVGLLIAHPVTISTAIDLGTVPVRVEGRGKFVRGGSATLTGTGPLTAPIGQIFEGWSAGLTFGWKVDAVHPRWWGALADGVQDDRAAIQAAFDAAPAEGVVKLAVGHKIAGTVYIRKPVTVVGVSRGNPSYVTRAASVGDTDYTARQVTASTAAFTIVPGGAAFQYYSAQTAASGVTFRDMKILGPGNEESTSSGLTGTGIDFDISGGPDVHFRGINVESCTIAFFDRAVALTGIAYLNVFTNTWIHDTNVGLYGAPSGASDNGGQTRLFGTTILFSRQWAIDWQHVGGSLSIFGSTVSEGNGGIRIHEESPFAIYGSEIESNRSDYYTPTNADAAGIFIDTSEANPNSGAFRDIRGNKFLSNTRDLYFKKTTAGFASGVQFPADIAANYFGSATALLADAAFDQPGFVFSGTNAGLDNGKVADSQLVNFAGADLRKTNWAQTTRRASGETFIYSGTGGADVSLGSVDVPNGAVLHFYDLQRYSINATTGARDVGNIFARDDAAALERISGYGNGWVADHAPWTNTTGTTRTIRIAANDAATGNPYYVRVTVSVVTP